jgi:hypothetical protein
MFWRTKQKVMYDHDLQLQLIDQQGQILGQQTILFSAAYWYPGQTNIKNHVINLSDALQPGIYVLSLEFKDKFDRESTSMPLGLLPIGITPPDNNLEIDFANKVRLAGYQLTPGESPNKFHISLNWQALQPLDKDYTVTLQLLDQNQNLVAQIDKPPLGGSYPTTVWQPGNSIFDSYSLELPESIRNGKYQLVVGLYDFQTLERLPVSSMGKNAPETGLATLQQIEINR